MEDQKDKTETSGKEAAERGKAAIEANKKINEKDKNPADIKKEEEKDAEKWHAEG
jgi:hypothetical protein